MRGRAIVVRSRARGVVTGLALALGAGVAACAFGGCVRSGGGPAADAEAARKLDPVLGRLAAQRPDTVIGVLIRVRPPVGRSERSRLEAAGVTVGTVAGPVVTGRARAGAAPELARLPFVQYIEPARPLSPTRRRDTVPRLY